MIQIFITSVGMGFGHRNCVVIGCPNSGKKLNKWATQTCNVHGCLNLTDTCNCEPPFKLVSFPSKLKDNAGWKQWTNAINRNIKKGKVWVPKNNSRVCSKHFVDGKPTDENPDPTENLGYDFKAKQTTGGKRKAPLDRSGIPVKKAKRPREQSSEASSEVNQDIPAYIDCDSNTNTTTGSNVSSSSCTENCNPAIIAEPQSENQNLAEKDEEIKQLKDQLHKLENELNICKKKLKKKREGLTYSDLETDNK